VRRGLLAFHEALLEGAATLVALLYGLVALLMTVDIGLRACRLGSLPWLLEATEYVLYGGTFLAAPWVLRKGAHVRVDLLLMSVPRSVAVAMEIVADAIGFAVSAILLWFGAAAALDAWRENAMQFKTWAMPEWILLALIPLGALLLMVEFALRVRRVRGVVAEEIDPTSRAGI
jgi:TRAP-type C4-dicarboxylate transport system permease small subunit